MRRRAIWPAIAVMAIALCLLPQAALAANRSAVVVGAGSSPFPAGTTFNGLTLLSYRFGVGLTVNTDGTATGDFLITLIGTYQANPWTGSVVNKAATGSVNPSGAVNFSGTAYIDMGGVMPPSSASFSAAGKDKQNTLSLTIGSTTWQVGTGTNGRLTVAVN